MNKLILILTTVVCVFQSDLSFAGGGPYPLTAEEEMSDFYKKMQTEIEIAETRVKLLLEKANRTDVIYTDIIRLELEIATTMLNVKQLLVANFIGTESLNSHHVREKLLSILKKEIITEIDLLELQLLVAIEKQKQGT